MDVDDATLPSDSEFHWDDPHTYKDGLPYGTLRIQQDEEFLSTSEVLDRIDRSQGLYHRLDLQHAELGDTKVEIVLIALREGSGPIRDNRSITFTDKEDSEAPNPLDWNRLIQPLSRCMTCGYKPIYGCFRTVNLDVNNLSSDCLPAICRFLKGNFTTRSLTLKANHIEGDVEGFSRLAQAVGRSGLRILSLSSNPIMPGSVAAFFDSIPQEGTSLECLELSNVFSDDLTGAIATEDEALVAAQAVASFIADPRRCRSLFALRLNGNSFGSRGARAIVLALISSALSTHEKTKRSLPEELSDLRTDPFYDTVLRARQRPPNRTLESLELLGNVDRAFEQEELDRDLEKFRSIRKRYTYVPIEEIKAIVSFFDERAQHKRLRKHDSPPQIPIEVSRHMSRLDVTVEQWEYDFQETAELGAGLSSLNWNKIYLDQLLANKVEGERCRRAALSILGAARTIGCRARRSSLAGYQRGAGRSDDPGGFPKFLELPPEIRLLVLSKLDEHSSLSASQFNNVISFACEPSTIGYGEPHYDWLRLLDGSPSGSNGDSASTLPAREWSWIECFSLRAPPRDWSADLLDASDQREILRPRRVLSNWGYAGAQPCMYAFLESTLTHRAEN